MSVCTFGLEELANLGAAVVDALGAPNPSGTLRSTCDCLALVSQANVACFNDRYSHLRAQATAHTSEEIGMAISRLDYAPGDSVRLAQALSTAQLLHYNCDDQGGDFTLKVEGAHRALISLLEALCIALARKAGIPRTLDAHD